MLAAINFKVIDPQTKALCNWVHHNVEEQHADSVFDTYEMTEGAVAFRKSALAAVGWYSDAFFFSHEGLDLSLRLMDHGYRTVYRGDIVVQHWHANAGRQSWTNHYYDTRNQYWVAARHFPVGYALTYLFRGQLSTFVYSVRDGHFRYWLRAVGHGIGGSAKRPAQRKALNAETMRLIRTIDTERPSVVLHGP